MKYLKPIAAALMVPYVLSAIYAASEDGLASHIRLLLFVGAFLAAGDVAIAFGSWLFERHMAKESKS